MHKGNLINLGEILIKTERNYKKNGNKRGSSLNFNAEFRIKLYFVVIQEFLCVFLFFLFSPWKFMGNCVFYFFDFFHPVPSSCTYRCLYSLDSRRELSLHLFRVTCTTTWRVPCARECDAANFQIEKLSDNSRTTTTPSKKITSPELKYTLCLVFYVN